MAKMRLLCAAGDTILAEWDPVLAKTDSEAAAAVDEAMKIFANLRSTGATVFKVRPGTDDLARRLDQFDPRVQEMIVVPRIAGG